MLFVFISDKYVWIKFGYKQFLSVISFAQVLVIGRCEGRIMRELIRHGVESIDVYDIGESGPGQAKVIIYFQNNGSIILVYFIKSYIFEIFCILSFYFA